MKITGGLAKGIPIKSSNLSTLRPATDYLRQAIFSSLGPIVENASFLDLFAGTGAYGLEAWSRGASNGIFVEKNRLLISNINLNIEAVAKSMKSNPKECKAFQADVFQLPIPKEHQFDLIFADPPYEIAESILQSLLDLAIKYLAKKTTSRFILEAPGHILPEHSDLLLLKKLGKTAQNAPSAFIWQFNPLFLNR